MILVRPLATVIVRTNFCDIYSAVEEWVLLHVPSTRAGAWEGGKWAASVP